MRRCTEKTGVRTAAPLNLHWRTLALRASQKAQQAVLGVLLPYVGFTSTTDTFEGFPTIGS